MRPPWSEDLLNHSLEDVVKSYDENKEWQKQLQLGIKVLMNHKLAHRIDQGEYMISRKLANEEMLECTRRVRRVSDEMLSRGYDHRLATARLRRAARKAISQ
jgi:hypothetical protein